MPLYEGAPTAGARSAVASRLGEARGNLQTGWGMLQASAQEREMDKQRAYAALGNLKADRMAKKAADKSDAGALGGFGASGGALLAMALAIPTGGISMAALPAMAAAGAIGGAVGGAVDQATASGPGAVNASRSSAGVQAGMRTAMGAGDLYLNMQDLAPDPMLSSPDDFFNLPAPSYGQPTNVGPGDPWGFSKGAIGGEIQ